VPCWENVRTAAASLRMKTKSVSSKPICPPKPAPPVPMADGALHVPSASLATTTPLPYRADPRNPALMTVRIARPYAHGYLYPGDDASQVPAPGEVEHTFALDNTAGGMILSGPKDCRGSMNEDKILLHLLHSAISASASRSPSRSEVGWEDMLTRHRRREGVMEAHRGRLSPHAGSTRQLRRTWRDALE
jgi:hypothetical protein